MYFCEGCIVPYKPKMYHSWKLRKDFKVSINLITLCCRQTTNLGADYERMAICRITQKGMNKVWYWYMANPRRPSEDLDHGLSDHLKVSSEPKKIWKHKFVPINHNIFIKSNMFTCFVTKSFRKIFWEKALIFLVFRVVSSSKKNSSSCFLQVKCF